MMTFENFKRRMDVLQEYDEYEGKLNDLGIRIWEQEEVSTLICEYVGMLNEAFSLERNSLTGTDIEYYIYELDFGKNAEEDDEIFSSLEKFYNYLCNPENFN